MARLRIIVLLAGLLLACISAVHAQDFSTCVFDGPDKPAVSSAPSHRIPALVQLSDGRLLAVADHRYGLSDVGAGQQARIELWFSHSRDRGLTWTEPDTVCPASTSRSNWQYAMGDAALVADRESPEVLLFCACGTVGMGSSTASKPIRIGLFRSHDNGETWDEGTDVTEQIYGLYQGDAQAIFITSGSLRQSRTVKQGTHYRIYAAFPVRTASRGNSTGAMFSDDFGLTWHLLGPADRFPEGTVYEEGKLEEMPDGNLALMVRDDNGVRGVSFAEKNFNFFRYTDVSTGAGEWSTAQSGITGMANACNSALLLVPACRKSDGLQVNVLLTTVPFHEVYARNATDNYGRRSVGFYYKEVASADDYASGEALAAGWERGYQVTDLCSAYADLQLLDDGYVGLLLEDNGRQGRGSDGNNETEAYDIVFYHLALQTITDGRYVAASPGAEGLRSQRLTPADTRFYDLLGRPAASPLTGLYVAEGTKHFVGK